MSSDDAREHLVPKASDRGFMQLPPIRQRYGYGESVRVYESSLATHPCVWLAIDDEYRAHLSVDEARKLAEQLLYLIDNHYNIERAEPSDPGSRVARQPEFERQRQTHIKLRQDLEFDLSATEIELCEHSCHRCGRCDVCCTCETDRQISRGVEYITDHYGSDESGDAA